MKIHFVEIGIISFFNTINKNLRLKSYVNYEISDNKKVIYVYAKMKDKCIELIQD